MLRFRKIKDLFNGPKQMYKPDNRALKIPKVLYPVIFLVQAVSLFLNSKKVDPGFLVIFYLIFAVYGTQGFVRFYLPDKILQLKKNRYINDKIKLIAFSNLHYSIRKLDLLVLLLTVVSVVLICVTGMYKNVTSVKIITAASYICVIVLIGISIFYKTIIGFPG